MQKITLVLGRVQALEQFVFARGRVPAHACVVAGGDLVGPQAHRMVQERLELDLGIAQDVRVGRAPGLVLPQELREHPVPVLGRKIDVLDLDAQHVRHRSGVDKVDIRRTILGVVVVLPVLHEDTDDLEALLLEQVGGHRGVHATTQPDHDPFS